MAGLDAYLLHRIADGGASRQNPFDAYLKGREARNSFDQFERKKASDYLGGQAVMGDKSALGEYAKLDPQGALSVQKNQYEMEAMEAERIANAYRQAETPEEFERFVNFFKQGGMHFDPGEDLWENRDAMIALGTSTANQLKEGKIPAEVQEYQFAQQQGFTGSLLDWHKSKQKETAPRTQITDLGGRRVLVDQNTGDTIRDLGESPVRQNSAPTGYRFREDGSGTLERIPGYRDLNYEGDLRKEFQGQTKDFRDVRDAYVRVQQSSKATTPAGDMSMIFAFMKLLDPTSVVRESEYASAENARGIPDSIRNAYNRAIDGVRLTPKQRADFLRQAERLYQGQERTFRETGNRYRGIAERAGLDPGSVVITPDVQESQGQGSNAFDANAQTILQEAQEARRRGVSLDAIRQRLEESGFDPSILEGLQ